MLLLLATKREAILRTESTHKEKQNPETLLGVSLEHLDSAVPEALLGLRLPEE